MKELDTQTLKKSDFEKKATNKDMALPKTYSNNTEKIQGKFCLKLIAAGNMKKHENAHTGEIIYKCEICKSTFLSKGGRRKHVKKVHENVSLMYI